MNNLLFYLGLVKFKFSNKTTRKTLIFVSIHFVSNYNIITNNFTQVKTT